LFNCLGPSAAALKAFAHIVHRRLTIIMMEKLHILLGGIMMTSMNIFGHVHALSLVGHLLRVPNFCASLLRGSVQERPILLNIVLFCTCIAVSIACGFFYY